MRYLIALLCVSCSAADAREFECERSSDCATDALCIAGNCETSESSAEPDTPEPRASPPKVAGPCAEKRQPLDGELVLNEVLANVPNDEFGDANGDGVRDAFEDEFVELVNVGAIPLELEGGRVLVGETLKHTFEPLCLLPNQALVIFGGGSVGSSVGSGAIIADRRLSLPNDGGEVTVIVGAARSTLAYQRAPSASLTRSPELTGDAWANHAELVSRPFSPGTCANGSSFERSCEEMPTQ